VVHYAEFTTHTASFLTEAEILAELLPVGLIVPEPAIVFVSFMSCLGVDVLGGRGYNIVSISVRTGYEGKKDQVEGTFPLVLWENDFLAVMSGRECLGAPKLLAEIPDLWQRDGCKGFTVSENGALLVEGEFRELVRLEGEDLEARLAEIPSEQNMLFWKYIPTGDFQGTSLSHMMLVPMRVSITDAWTGNGEAAFHARSWEQAPISGFITSRLRQLPVLEWQGGFAVRGSQDLLLHRQRRIE
jgi:acetoacetate decarboxylase